MEKHELGDEAGVGIWGGGFLSQMLDLLPEDYQYRDSALWCLDAISPITGGMSFILYYARGLLEVMLLFKHTCIINGWAPWMSDAERDMALDWHERFPVHWAYRQYRILNDIIWATCNLLCFYWLQGDEIAYGALTWGYYGNVLTALLLLMDVALTWMRFQEEREAFLQQQYALERDLNILADEHTEQKIFLEQLQCFNNIEWRHREERLQQDFIYAVLLLAAFVVVCCAFVTPVAPSIAMVFNVVGSAMCWALTVWNDTMNEKLNMDHAKDWILVLKADKNDDAPDLNQRIQDYEALAHEAYLRMIYNLSIELLIPPTLFGVLVFCPFTEALLLLGVAVVLAKMAESCWMSQSLSLTIN